MAYIPENAEWYVAEVVEEITVEGDARNVVHKNLILIHAHSPEEAYDRTIEFGKQSETAYQNPAEKDVVIRFRGIRKLSVVHDDLEHGAELGYTEEVSVPEDKIAELVKSKEQLSVFSEIEPSSGPDYSSKEIVEEAYELMRRSRPLEPENQ
jgi:hypothetical protein